MHIKHHQGAEKCCRCMQGLRKQPGNHAHALHQVPRNSRHLYVHAYQSYLWNAAASHRVQAHGAKAAVAGDLVIPSGGTEPADSAFCCCSALPALAFSSCREGDALTRQELPAVTLHYKRSHGSAEWSRLWQTQWAADCMCRLPASCCNAEVDGSVSGALCCSEKDAEAVEETSDKRTTGHLAAVHVVTEEEAATGAFAIDDVVLPLPGSCITYPQHSTAEVCVSAQLLLSQLCLAPSVEGACMLDEVVYCRLGAAPAIHRACVGVHSRLSFNHDAPSGPLLQPLLHPDITPLSSIMHRKDY